MCGRFFQYSNKLRKVFIDINKQIVVYFKWDFEKAACNDFFIRALPVYTQGDWSTIPVERCPIHVSPEDVSNTGTLNFRKNSKFNDFKRD